MRTESSRLSPLAAAAIDVPSLPPAARDTAHRWIVWKLAAIERRFPKHFPQGYLTADRVAKQLQHRYAPGL